MALIKSIKAEKTFKKKLTSMTCGGILINVADEADEKNCSLKTKQSRKKRQR